MAAADPQRDVLQTLIVGAGVAALEAAAALRALAPDRVALTVLAPDESLKLRQTAVRDLFTGAAARSYPLAPLLARLGAERRVGRFRWVDVAQREVHTAAGETLRYDALLLAMGARQRPRFHHALTLTAVETQDHVRDLLCAIDAGAVSSVAFIVPSTSSWPLPLYELAILTAGHAARRGIGLHLTLITPEDAPLAILGDTASREVERLLGELGIMILTGQRCQVQAAGRVAVHPAGTELQADRVVAMPELFGPSTPGIPTTAARGFLSIDGSGAVRDVPCVYAAGDATDRAIKHGSVAAEQADAAAVTIAALAGVPVDPHPSRQTVHALLLGSDDPLLIAARLGGEQHITTEVGAAPLRQPPRNLYVPYLAPHLKAMDAAPAPQSPAVADAQSAAIAAASADAPLGFRS